jgi:hypothetical protein
MTAKLLLESPPVLVPNWPAPASIYALVTTRAGGVSEAPYDSLNLGKHVGDAPDKVSENRVRVRHLLPNEPIWLEQVHGTRVWHSGDDYQADAAISAEPEQVIAVLTADCMPVFFCNRAGNLVGVAHAGWRGLCAGVLENTVQALCEKSLALGQTLARANILVWLGPAIGPSCFEVGNEVREQFIDAARLTGAGFPVETFQAIPGKPQKYWANLYHLARSRLKNAGIQAIYGGNFCTFTQSEQFFSHRRDGVSGRFAALIWLAAPRN